MDYLKLTTDVLSVDEISNLVVDDSCGAVSIFIGTTRDNFEGKKVVRLEYEAYEPMALKSMRSICDDIRNKWPTVHSIAIYHRLGMVPTRESSVVIAISSPHRQQSLDAVAHCIDQLKAQVPIWKKEVYETHTPVWKENVESTEKDVHTKPSIPKSEELLKKRIPNNLVQINVTNEELQKRIENFINVKREQVNINNVHDFIPSKSETEDEEAETCARVRTLFVRRNDSKGHLKIRKVHNEWGPQTMLTNIKQEPMEHSGLPSSIAERVLNIERFLNTGPVSKDIYRRLKEMEDKIATLTALSPEYAQFWKSNKDKPDDSEDKNQIECVFTAEDIASRIEELEREANF